MKKGKFGLSPAAIAVIAFIFVLLRQPIAVLLICGFALLAEKDEWLNRQTIQALLLMIAYYVADLIQGWIFGGLATFFGWVKLFKVASVMATISSIVGTILYLALAVFSVIAIIKLLGGKDAGLPLISQIASGDFVIKEKRRPAPAPVQPQYAAPAPPPAPVVEEAPAPVPAAPAPSTSFCANCGAPMHEGAVFCAECGTKVG